MIRIASRHYIEFYDEQLTMNVVLLHQAINIHNDFCSIHLVGTAHWAHWKHKLQSLNTQGDAGIGPISA